MTIPQFPLFNQLYNECISNPNKYLLDNKIKMTISTLPKNRRDVIETIYYIIHHYHILEVYQNYSSNSYQTINNWNKTIQTVEPKISTRSKKTLIYLVEYGGKTFENGNGIIYSSDINIPEFLKQMISAYITLISH